ncbi:MAG: UDP-N-acetylglucosamine 2-epimerase [Lachnospiraceae bacterium]|nr:UDP-N-acetylglucosamine 2-epimerase [Lachnospiraceae bacterium]
MKQIYFFIGTEAELIKVFPVITECQNRGSICHIIASGQNELNKSRIMKHIQLNGEFFELSKEKDIVKSALGLLKWFFDTKRKAIPAIQGKFKDYRLSGEKLVVHGDTVSTMMGAMIGKRLGMQICHVEAGLRSHHLFNPFPEEIDRLITSKIARVHFAPGAIAEKNLVGVKGKVINTEYNTILDSLSESRNLPIQTDKVVDVLEQKYFVFVMHRQENLMNKYFVQDVLEQIRDVSKQMKCVFILHKITEKTLIEMNLLNDLKKDKNCILMPRVDYFDFMKLLACSQFVITDGGSNQEELHYMGKPCLIMRKTTERNEGIGQNAILFGGEVKMIADFVDEYEKYKIPPVVGTESPSKIIAEYLFGNDGRV